MDMNSNLAELSLAVGQSQELVANNIACQTDQSPSVEKRYTHTKTHKHQSCSLHGVYIYIYTALIWLCLSHFKFNKCKGLLVICYRNKRNPKVNPQLNNRGGGFEKANIYLKNRGTCLRECKYSSFCWSNTYRCSRFTTLHRTGYASKMCTALCAKLEWPSLELIVGRNNSVNGDNWLVRAPGSWSKGPEFESTQERRENFLFSRINFLYRLLLAVFVPPPTSVLQL